MIKIMEKKIKNRFLKEEAENMKEQKLETLSIQDSEIESYTISSNGSSCAHCSGCTGCDSCGGD